MKQPLFLHPLIARYILLVTLVISTSIFSPLFAQSGSIKLTFSVVAPGLSSDSSIYITGSNPQLGSWQPGKVKMEYAGNQTWLKSIVLDKPGAIEYKYTLGGWDRQAALKSGAPMNNLEVKFNGDKIVRDSVAHWTATIGKPVLAGRVTGNVRYHRNLKFEGLKERDVIVWLPPGYDADKDQRYPVLYMHDGQNIMDPGTSAFGYDWQVDEAADSLIKNHIIPPTIIVGIYNTSDRMKEYMPGTMSVTYSQFIIKNLKPMIDATYRTKPDAANTFTGGSSAGGMMAFMLVYEHPEVFSKAICMSPALKIDQYDYVQHVLAGGKKDKPVFFYIDNGGLGLEGQLQPGIEDMLAALKERGYQEWKDFVFVSEPEARHFEADWAKRFPAALSILFQVK